jgi:tRNA(Ile)-lysidine synthase
VARSIANRNALTAKMSAAAPLGEAEIAALFEPLNAFGHVLAAVSGGSDSMALMGLLAQWARAQPHLTLSIATVDHGFRPEARAEAEFVAQTAEALGLSCTILTREGPVPDSGLQEAAREARYDLLYGCARAIDARVLVTAHHADDQAETVLMRLCHASGPSGLAGMRSDMPRGAVTLMRPFLNVPKARLAASLVELGLESLNDPSNADPRFERVRLRHLGDVLAGFGLTRERLGLLAKRAARADAALDRAAETAFVRHRLAGPNGMAFAGTLFGEPREIILRVLAKGLARTVSDRQVRLERLEDLTEALCRAYGRRETLGRTLGGAVVRLSQAGWLNLDAEGPRGGQG